MQKLIRHLEGDKVIWVISLIMLGFSLISVYSFVPILIKMQGGNPFSYLLKHLFYVCLSFGAMYWIHKKDPKYFSQLSKFAYYLSVGLMIFTFFFGMEVNNAGRWVRIPFVGLTFQSSDFAKLALIIYLSRLMVNKQSIINDWKKGFFPLILPVFVICGLILKDNFSTAAILFAICLVLLFIGRVPFSRIFSLIGLVFGALALAVLLQLAIPSARILPRLDTWINRIVNKVDDDKNITENAQAINAKLAVYNGGFLGQGVGDGQLKHYLPEAYADFYYSSFVEEFGSGPAIILVLMYLILLFRIIRIGLKSKKTFETYVCIGIGILLLSQASVNMLVCVGIFPVTGQNMPLLAMGGSALIMTCVGIGVVQSIARNQELETSQNEK